MIFYHLTSEINAKKILNEGFKLKERNYIKAYGNGIYLTVEDRIPVWYGVLKKDIFPNEEMEIIKCEIDNNLKIMEFGTSGDLTLSSIAYKEVNEWYFKNKHEVDSRIEKNESLKILNDAYNDGNKERYKEQNIYGFKIELFCKEHLIDGAISFKFPPNDLGNKKYEDVVVYDPSKIRIIGLTTWKTLKCIINKPKLIVPLTL